MHQQNANPAQTSAATTKTCPFCAETIQAAAIVCRYCSRELTTFGLPAAAAPAASQPREEITYLETPRITVTSARVIVKDKTYAVGALTSVEIRRERPLAMFVSIFAAMGAFFGIAMAMLNYQGRIHDILMHLIIAVVSLAVPILAWIFEKPTAQVVLQTATNSMLNGTSISNVALSTPDLEEAQGVHDAISAAIVGRG